MATIQKFEDLTVWQMSLALAMDVYKTLADCKDYGLRDQMQRSSVSIPSNISEGFEREYNKEFIRFLKVSKGSAGELRTQIYIAMGIGIIDNEMGEVLLDKSRHISSMLRNLIKVRETNFS